MDQPYTFAVVPKNECRLQQAAAEYCTEPLDRRGILENETKDGTTQLGAQHSDVTGAVGAYMPELVAAVPSVLHRTDRDRTDDIET